LAEIEMLAKIEREAFGIGGMNEWMIVPLIRHGKVYALFYGDEIIGGAYFMRDWDFPEKVYLLSIAVAAAHQGKGMGTFLLKEALGLLKKEGIEKVELTVDPRNIGAVSIYHDKLGFTTKMQRKNEYGEGEDRLVMELDLASFTAC